MTRLLEMPLGTYYIYVIHLMIAVSMPAIKVPLAKWTHQLAPAGPVPDES